MQFRGEEREYRIVLGLQFRPDCSRKIFFFLIDKNPAPPEPKTEPGKFFDSVDIDFSNTENTVVYSINKPVFQAGIIWDRKPIKLTAEQGTAYFEVYAYSVDKAGNKSKSKTMALCN